MGIPHWLLRLLPMWDYICPRCNREVPKKSHECPFCHERYPTPMKVPPKLYKDRRALEEYVHKHVFPKVTQAHRECLAQFFTELLNDGFESGDFSAWTGTAGSPSVVTTLPHCGSYHMRSNSSGGDQTPYAYFTLSPSENIVYIREYVYFASGLPLTDDGDRFHIISTYSFATGMIHATVQRNSGADYFGLRIQTATYYTDVTPAAETWYCIEILYDNVNGTQKMWVDGTLKISQPWSTSATIDSVRCGIAFSSGVQNSMDVYTDCVVVADAYIGPEATLQTIADSFSLSETVLNHKTLSLSDSLGLNDLLYGDKTLLLSDSASLSELIAVILGEVTKHVADCVTVADVSKVLKTLKLSDTLTLVDAASTPFRVLRALDAVGVATDSRVNKTLQINEAISLAEVVDVGVGGVKKTKLFLILGDLAVQLTGD